MNRRLTQKTFKVFCEGNTEYHYFDVFKKTKRLSLRLRPINMEGGGYASFLRELRKDASTNCIAKFVVIDADKALTDRSELERLEELVSYCKIQNDSKRVPHILIIDSPSFEYVACLHSPKYTGTDVSRFIISQYHYRSIGDYKADTRIYDVLNSNGNSYSVFLNKCNRTNTVINNSISVKPSKFNLDVKMLIDFSNLRVKCTNLFDFFDVLGKFEKNIIIP